MWVWVWVWVSLAPTIEEHTDNVNALCNHRRSPREHSHMEPWLSSRVGSSMSFVQRLILPDLVLKALLHTAIGFV